jgi:hypothetical protein
MYAGTCGGLQLPSRPRYVQHEDATARACSRVYAAGRDVVNGNAASIHFHVNTVQRMFDAIKGQHCIQDVAELHTYKNSAKSCGFKPCVKGFMSYDIPSKLAVVQFAIAT